MKNLLLVGALSATSLAASPAIAEAVPFGARVEGLVGYDKIMEHENRLFSDAADASYRFGHLQDESIVYGGRVGYDFGVGSFAVGVDGEITNTNTKDSRTTLTPSGDLKRFRFKGGTGPICWWSN